MTLQIGDRVRFRRGHPWEGHIGEYVGEQELPILRTVQSRFKLVGEPFSTVARPAQYVRLSREGATP